MLTVGIRVDAVIIVSNVAVELLMNAVTDIIRGVLSNIDVDVLVDVNVNMFAVSMAAFEFVMSDPLEEFRCSAAFDCRPMAALDCVSVLQAWMPSYHV